MTLIVALKDKDSVWMGGDSGGFTSDYHGRTEVDEKIYRNGPFVIGYAGSFRIGQIVRYDFVPPKKGYPKSANKASNEDWMLYFIKHFIPDLKKCISSNDAETEIEDAVLLIAVKNKFFEIALKTYQVEKCSDKFTAIGGGYCYALPALSVLEKECSHLNAQTKIEKAMDASSEFYMGIRKPYTILNTKNKAV